MWFRIQYAQDRPPISHLVGEKGCYCRLADIAQFINHLNPSTFAPHIQRRGKDVLPRGLLPPVSITMHTKLVSRDEMGPLIKGTSLEMWMREFRKNGGRVKFVPLLPTTSYKVSPLLIPDPNGIRVSWWIVRYIVAVKKRYAYKLMNIPKATNAVVAAVTDEPPDIVSYTTTTTTTTPCSAADAAAAAAAAASSSSSNTTVLGIDAHSRIFTIPFDQDQFLPTHGVLKTPNKQFYYVPVP